MKLPKTILVSLLVCSGSSGIAQEADAQQHVSVPGHPNYHVYTNNATPGQPSARVNAAEESKRYQELMNAERNPGNRNEKLIRALQAMAAVYTGVDANRRNHYLRRASDAERRAGRNVSPTASQLAMNYFHERDYVHAEPYLQQWLQEVETNFNAGGGPGNLNYNAITVLDHLAVASLKMGKVVQAGTYLERMKTLYQTAGVDHGHGSYYPVSFLKTYAEYLDKSGRSGEAREYRELATEVRGTMNRPCVTCGRG